MRRKSGDIDRSTDVRANRGDIGGRALAFRWKSGAASDNIWGIDTNIKKFGQFFKDNYYKKKTVVWPQWVLNILNKAYKDFIKLHSDIEETEKITLWKEIVNSIAQDNEKRFSIGFYALVIIQETKGSIDKVFLEEEIFNKNPQFKGPYAEVMGFNREAILRVLNDPFIIEKLK